MLTRPPSPPAAVPQASPEGPATPRAQKDPGPPELAKLQIGRPPSPSPPPVLEQQPTANAQQQLHSAVPPPTCAAGKQPPPAPHQQQPPPQQQRPCSPAPMLVAAPQQQRPPSPVPPPQRPCSPAPQPAAATQQQPQRPCSPEPLRLYPSPFCSRRFRTGGWPIGMLPFVVPSPWEPLEQAQERPQLSLPATRLGGGGLRPISVGKPRGGGNGSSGVTGRGLGLGGLFSRRK